MHPIEVHEEVRRLVAEGLRDSEIADVTGLARTTVRDIRAPRRSQCAMERCHRCWGRTKPIRCRPGDYAELLGLYLGDGCISRAGRVFRLRITFDQRYPGIVRDTRALLARSFPTSSVGLVARRDGAVVVSAYSSHMACLFPQHGPGKKHHRAIVLEAWQQGLVDLAPWRFLRGCIRSDGCVFVNRTGPYEYLSYDFSNRSEDIRELFVRTCRAVGLEPRPAGYSVRIYRRASVALLQEHVGAKS